MRPLTASTPSPTTPRYGSPPTEATMPSCTTSRACPAGRSRAAAPTAGTRGRAPAACQTGPSARGAAAPSRTPPRCSSGLQNGGGRIMFRPQKKEYKLVRFYRNAVHMQIPCVFCHNTKHTPNPNRVNFEPFSAPKFRKPNQNIPVDHTAGSAASPVEHSVGCLIAMGGSVRAGGVRRRRAPRFRAARAPPSGARAGSGANRVVERRIARQRCVVDVLHARAANPLR